MQVELVHDYVTQRGGAERVVLSMVKAFPGAPLHTSLHDPSGSFPEFATVDIRPSPLNRVGVLRHRHRMALPFLASTFDHIEVHADVAVCSSSGWAHGAHTTGRKIVYCHNPARWLYQRDRYLDGRGGLRGAALTALRRRLGSWDEAAAASADRYLVNSSIVCDRVRHVYGIDAEVLNPPHTMDARLPRQPIPGLDAGFVLCVARLLPYKNVDAVVDTFSLLPEHRLVVVGSGPELPRLQARARDNVTFAGQVDDAELRWLYANAAALVAASYEDFGLTPLEANAFGTPVAALRFGGFLDTVVDGTNGVLFDEPTPLRILLALRRILGEDWDAGAIKAHAEQFSEARFVERLRGVVAEELGCPLDDDLVVQQAAS